MRIVRFRTSCCASPLTTRLCAPTCCHASCVERTSSAHRGFARAWPAPAAFIPSSSRSASAPPSGTRSRSHQVTFTSLARTSLLDHLPGWSSSRQAAHLLSSKMQYGISHIPRPERPHHEIAIVGLLCCPKKQSRSIGTLRVPCDQVSEICWKAALLSWASPNRRSRPCRENLDFRHHSRPRARQLVLTRRCHFLRPPFKR